MPVYTQILEYAGVTYLSQNEADDELSSVLAWAEQLDLAAFDGFDLADSQRLMTQLQTPTLQPVSHLINVWNLNLAFGHELAILHLVQTDVMIE